MRQIRQLAVLAFAIGAFAAVAGSCSLSTVDNNVPDPIDPAQDTYAAALNVDLTKMIKLESGVYFADSVVGTGPPATSASVIKFYYNGYLTNGYRFQTNQGGIPIEVSLTDLIPGWQYGILGMQVGGWRKLIVPAALAYGRTGDPNGGIPPNANLVFTIQLLTLR
jgi:FKBP-type peptidyl-prolyl cis-trans isomerase FkpA